jgi:hypothetical protein
VLVRANNRCSRMSSVSSAGTGQAMPLACARRRLSWIVLRGHAQRAPDLARAHPIMVQPQYVSQLSHGQLSLRRHPNLFVVIEEGWLPESLTRRTQRSDFRTAAWRPASPRKGGRLQFGMVAGFKSESRPASIGIPGRNASFNNDSNTPTTLPPNGLKTEHLPNLPGGTAPRLRERLLPQRCPSTASDFLRRLPRATAARHHLRAAPLERGR